MHCSSIPKRDYSHASQDNHTRIAQNPKPQNNPPKKQAIKVGKGEDKVIVQSGSDEDTATGATLETTRSSKNRSSQRGEGEKGLREEEVKEPRPNTPSGFHEYPNPI